MSVELLKPAYFVVGLEHEPSPCKENKPQNDREPPSGPSQALASDTCVSDEDTCVEQSPLISNDTNAQCEKSAVSNQLPKLKTYYNKRKVTFADSPSTPKSSESAAKIPNVLKNKKVIINNRAIVLPVLPKSVICQK